MSLLIHEGVSVLEVAAKRAIRRVCLNTYGHVFDEFDASERTPADVQIRRARDKLVPVSYLSGG